MSPKSKEVIYKPQEIAFHGESIYEQLGLDISDCIMVDCECCLGTGSMGEILAHSEACADVQECIGSPFCPVTLEKNCPYCLDGQVAMDYAFYRVAWQFELSKVGYKLINHKVWLDKIFEINMGLWRLEKAEMASPMYREVSKRKGKFIVSARGWSTEHVWNMIVTVLKDVNFPVTEITKREIFNVRTYYGCFEPQESEEHFNRSIGEKYREFKNQTPKSHALLSR